VKAGILVFLEKLRLLVRLFAGRCSANCLRLRGARIGMKPNFGRRLNVARPWGLQMGSRAMIEDDVYLKLAADSARLVLGERVFIGRGCEIDVIEHVRIGDNVLLAPGVFITDHNHGMLANHPMNEQPCTSAPVVIGDDCWIGAGAVILPGVTIGSGAIVGANAVVTSIVEPNSMVAGIPARLLRQRAGGA
jgi:acetyltransferase-like isoleucine patch superfamily enzyme